MLTKQEKADWLRALNSGKYTRCTSRLFNPETNKHCCLGVLADINPNLLIHAEGLECVVNGKMNGYKPIEDLLGFDAMRDLYVANDTIPEGLDPTYNMVMNIIGTLPTSD